MASTSTKTTVETIYWLPYCSTCVKAEQHLKTKGADINKYVNVKEEKVSLETVKELAALLSPDGDGVEKLFSKRAMKYRAWGLHEKELSEADMLNYMVEEYTFIKRPVIVLKMADGSRKALAGFSAKQYDALFQ